VSDLRLYSHSVIDSIIVSSIKLNIPSVLFFYCFIISAIFWFVTIYLLSFSILCETSAGRRKESNIMLCKKSLTKSIMQLIGNVWILIFNYYNYSNDQHAYIK
jgi:hypothetical protein